MDTLFELEDTGSFDRDRLRDRLASLALDKVFVGGSSWKYEGWLGQIYQRSNYLVRGKCSKSEFERNCLREYAGVFSTVCGDFAFYQFPTEDFWRRLFAQTPEGFQFSFKVPEQITCKVFPSHPRYGAQGGAENAAFLDAGMLRDLFLRALLPYRTKTGVLIFEFGTFPKGTFSGAGEFAERLDPFLAALPADFRYAVEIRNREFLDPAYFECLRGHGVAHVYNAWTRMPELRDQLAIPQARTAGFSVCRALLRYGRSYENAVRDFSPYSEIRDPNPEVRSSLREMIEGARADRRAAYIYVNNRLEGNSPFTIDAVVNDAGAES